jgi:hypothetical protein
MSYSEQQLDAVVRQVLERLGALQQVPQRVIVPSQATTVSVPAGNPESQSLSARVIGTRELEAVKPETKRVVVQHGSVVTPAARDWLREKQIELAWAANGLAKTTQNGGNAAVLGTKPATSMIVLGQAASRFDGTALVRQVESRGYKVQRLAHSGLPQVASELAAAAAFDGVPAILLTDQPWAAVVAANRHASARAAWVRDRRETIAAIREAAINVAIVNVTGQSPFGILNTILPFIERQ